MCALELCTSNAMPVLSPFSMAAPLTLLCLPCTVDHATLPHIHPPQERRHLGEAPTALYHLTPCLWCMYIFHGC
jgi:hypothetical protein